ncbi:MAG: hypothetical protein RBR08_15590 [Desulforegulaceae bacterium]|nr:hypothetical protein [Desulforegulaceae bacterium]
MKKINFLIILLCLFSASGIKAYELGNIDIHGFLSQGYMWTTDNNYLGETDSGTFQFNEYGINFSTDLTDNLRFGLQFFGRDLGKTGNDELTIDWAYLDYRYRDWLGVRVGNVKLVLGLYNEYRDMDMLRTTIFLPQSIYIELWRDTFAAVKGITFYGNKRLGSLGKFSYTAQIGQLPTKDNTGFVDLMESRSVFKQNNVEITDVDAGYVSTIGLGWDTPVKGFKLNYTMYNLNDFDAEGKSSITTGVGPSGLPYSYLGKFKYKTTKMWGLIGGFEYSKGDLLLAGEYMKSEYKARGDVFADLPVGEFETSLPAQGWYVSSSYRFTDLFSAALTYSDYIPNTDDRDGDEFKKIGEKDFKAWLKTVTLSTRFDINSFVVFKMEASQNHGWGHHDPLGVSSKGLKEDWTLLSAKLTVSF